jgi:type IV pilus assembly protein PilE
LHRWLVRAFYETSKDKKTKQAGVTTMERQTGSLCSRNHGFTIIELMIAVAVVAVIMAIAIPVYRGYVETARRSVAESVLASFPILVEQHRAETGWMSNPGVAGTVHTFAYRDPGSDTITPLYPEFKPRSPGQADDLYHYRLVITIAACPPAPGGVRETAVATAMPQANAPPGNITIDFN